MFYGNTDNIKAFKDHCDKYDTTDVITIPDIFNCVASNPLDRWGGPEKRLCLLNHWSKFPLNKFHIFIRKHQAILRLMRSAASGFAILLMTILLRRYVIKSKIFILHFLKQVLKEVL